MRWTDLNVFQKALEKECREFYGNSLISECTWRGFICQIYQVLDFFSGSQNNNFGTFPRKIMGQQVEGVVQSYETILKQDYSCVIEIDLITMDKMWLHLFIRENQLTCYVYSTITNETRRVHDTLAEYRAESLHPYSELLEKVHELKQELYRTKTLGTKSILGADIKKQLLEIVSDIEVYEEDAND